MERKTEKRFFRVFRMKVGSWSPTQTQIILPSFASVFFSSLVCSGSFSFVFRHARQEENKDRGQNTFYGRSVSLRIILQSLFFFFFCSLVRSVCLQLSSDSVRLTCSRGIYWAIIDVAVVIFVCTSNKIMSARVFVGGS